MFFLLSFDWFPLSNIAMAPQGVRVDLASVTFVASQPWLFPRSLLLGCTAEALDDQIRVDNEELEAHNQQKRLVLLGKISRFWIFWGWCWKEIEDTDPCFGKIDFAPIQIEIGCLVLDLAWISLGPKRFMQLHPLVFRMCDGLKPATSKMPLPPKMRRMALIFLLRPPWLITWSKDG